MCRHFHFYLQEIVHKQLPAKPNKDSTHLVHYRPASRVPPLPNEMEASSHMTVTPSNESLKSEKSQSGAPCLFSSVLDTWGLQALLSDPSNIQTLKVEEATKLGTDEDAAKLIQMHTLVLESIDQQLLELGPFAKDAYPPLTSSSSSAKPDTTLPLAHPQSNHRLNSPTESHHIGRRGPRKGTRLSNGSAPSPKSTAANKRVSRGSEDNSLTGLKLLGEEKVNVSEKEVPPVRKWRKVGSAGTSSSSSREQSTENLMSSLESPITSSNPIVPKSTTVATTVTSTSNSSVPSFSPRTIIPAASEMEMLSLYFPNEWETASSPPPDHDSSDTMTTRSASPQRKSEKAVSQDLSSPSTEAVMERLVANRSDNSRTTTPELASSVQPVSTSATATPSSLTTAVARHTSNQHPHPFAESSYVPTSSGALEGKYPVQSDLIVVDDTPTSLYKSRPTRHSYTESHSTIQAHETKLPTSIPGELSRHVVVSGGIPIPRSGHSNPHTTSSRVSPGTRIRSDEHSFRPQASSVESSRVVRNHHLERSTGSPSQPGHGFVVMNPQLSTSTRRRNSSTSSFTSHLSSDSLPASFKQPPSSNPRVNDQGDKVNSTPQQPDPKLHGAPGGDPKFGIVNPYAIWPNGGQFKVSEGSQSAIPGLYPNPFLPTYLHPQAGVIAAGIPQFPTSVFPLDPNSGFKPNIYGSPLLQYRYPFPAAQNLGAFQSPTSLNTGPKTPGGSQPGTPTVTVGLPLGSQQPLYNLPSSPGVSAFKNIQEAALARSNASTPPVFHPSPPMGRVGSLPLNRDDNKQATNEGHPLPDKVPNINWLQMQSPQIIGTNLTMMPYFTSLGQPTSAMNMFNPRLPVPLPVTSVGNLTNTMIRTGSEGNVAKLGTSKDPQLSLKVHHRRGSVASVNGSVPTQHDSPRHQSDQGSVLITQIPSAGGPLQLPPHPFGPADIAKWNPVHDKSGSSPPLSIGLTFAPGAGGVPLSVPHAKPSVIDQQQSHILTSEQQKMIGHMRPGPRGSGPQSRRRLDSAGGKSSPKAPGERMKLRIHQVRDDDFKNAGKIDGRRRRWKGKDKGVTLITQPPTLEEAPSQKQEVTLKKIPGDSTKKESVSLKADVPTTLGQDENYGLNILAAMSSIQKREQGETTFNTLPQCVSESPLAVSTAGPVDASSLAKLPSPVSLAGARSLLLLGNDVQSPEKEISSSSAENTLEGGHPSDVTHVESSVVDTLLQLSGSVSVQNETKKPSQDKTDRQEGAVEDNSSFVQRREIRSDSYSAAEAMLLMVGTDRKEDLKDTAARHKQVALEEVFVGPVSKQQNEAVEEDRDSEATDTDSEATLTPDSPGWKVPGKTKKNRRVSSESHSPCKPSQPEIVPDLQIRESENLSLPQAESNTSTDKPPELSKTSQESSVISQQPVHSSLEERPSDLQLHHVKDSKDDSGTHLEMEGVETTRKEEPNKSSPVNSRRLSVSSDEHNTHLKATTQNLSPTTSSPPPQTVQKDQMPRLSSFLNANVDDTSLEKNPRRSHSPVQDEIKQVLTHTRLTLLDVSDISCESEEAIMEENLQEVENHAKLPDSASVVPQEETSKSAVQNLSVASSTKFQLELDDSVPGKDHQSQNLLNEEETTCSKLDAKFVLMTSLEERSVVSEVTARQKPEESPKDERQSSTSPEAQPTPPDCKPKNNLLQHSHRLPSWSVFAEEAASGSANDNNDMVDSTDPVLDTEGVSSSLGSISETAPKEEETSLIKDSDPVSEVGPLANVNSPQETEMQRSSTPIERQNRSSTPEIIERRSVTPPTESLMASSVEVDPSVLSSASPNTGPNLQKKDNLLCIEDDNKKDVITAQQSPPPPPPPETLPTPPSHSPQATLDSTSSKSDQRKPGDLGTKRDGSPVSSLPEKQEKKTSPIVAPQNRLPVAWKPGSKFDRFQHRKHLSGKLEDRMTKKRPKQHQDVLSHSKLLFNVDSPPPHVTPSHSHSSTPTGKAVWKDRKEKRQEGVAPRDLSTKEDQVSENKLKSRKIKVRPSPGLGHSTPGGQPKRPKIDRSKLSNSGGSTTHGPPRSLDSHHDYDNPIGRHSQPSSVPHEVRSYSREPSKPRSRPPSRQSNRTSRSPVPSSRSTRSPPPVNPRDRDPSPYSDEEHPIRSSSSVRHPSHDVHSKWSKRERSPDFSKERLISHGKHPKVRERRDGLQVGSGVRKHPDDQSSIFQPGSRKDRSSSRPLNRSITPEHKHHQHHYNSSREGSWMQSDSDSRSLNGKGDARRQSYESVSDDDIISEPISHRDGTHTLANRTGYETSSGGRGVSGSILPWGGHKERKRPRPEQNLDNDSVMLEHYHKVARVTTSVKHKKHKHKDHKEKWRKSDGKETAGKMKVHGHHKR